MGSNLWPFSDSIFNHQSTSKPALTPRGEIGSVPSLNQLPQPGLIGIPAVKEAFIILLSSGLIFPLPVTHHHKYIVMRSLLHTHTEKHTHSRTDKQLHDYGECTSGSLRRRQTAQMLQRQDTQRATVISMPVLCAAVLICSPCLEKEFCLVSLALGSALCRESSPPSPSSVFQPFSSIFLVDFIGRYMTWMEEKERQLDEGDILL